jgi:hypothetical protein
LKAAQAALLVARENVLAQRGAYCPSVSAGFSASHSKTSNVVSPFTASGSLYYSLYTPQVSVSFVPDVFGLNRRTVESLKAQEQQARFALAATHITLSSNVAAAAIQEASLRGQIDATHELITINAVPVGRAGRWNPDRWLFLKRRRSGSAPRKGRGRCPKTKNGAFWRKKPRKKKTQINLKIIEALNCALDEQERHRMSEKRIRRNKDSASASPSSPSIPKPHPIQRNNPQ